MEYIEKCPVVDNSVYIRFDGKIANGYIQDFRHSWPFQDGGELKSENEHGHRKWRKN